MIIEHRHCEHCQSINIIRNGKNRSGTQTYKCKDCGSYRVLDSKQKSRQIASELIERTYLERQSLRGTARVFGISHTSVQEWLKKKHGH
jgi:insertion element IS1 protein InsB